MNRFITGNTMRSGTQPEDSDTWSSSKVSPFVPFISLFNGTTISKGGDKTLLYSLPLVMNQRGMGKYNKYLQAVNHMAESLYIKNLTTTRNPKTYQVAKGFMGCMDENYNVIPLIVLCVKSDAIYSLDKNNLDKKKFCLVINTAVFSEEHALMFKNMRKYYVDTMADDGIDILYTNDINSWLFNPLDYIPKFNTVTDMVNHLGTISNLALGIETKTEDEQRGIEIIDDMS